MGNICSSPNAEVPTPTAATRPARPRRVVDISTWDKDFPVMTRAELERKREEFWDTRVEGRAECWQALRLAAQAGDEATAKAIMSSAGLTPFEVSDKVDFSYCYDERGFRYDVPMYVIHEPRNLMVGRIEPTVKVAVIDEKAVKPARATGQAVDTKDDKKKEEPQGPGTKIKLRLSTGQDISTVIYPTDTILEMKKRVYFDKGVELERQKVLFQGKILPDTGRLGSYNLSKGTVLQVFIRPRRQGDGEGPVYESLRQEAAQRARPNAAGVEAGLSTPVRTALNVPDSPMSPMSPLPLSSPLAPSSPDASASGAGPAESTFSTLSSELATATLSESDPTITTALEQSSSAAAYTVNTSEVAAH